MENENRQTAAELGPPALAFTALVTPFEIAFLQPPDDWRDGLFLVNRVVDLVFALDTIVNFLLCFERFDPGTQLSVWVVEPRAIVEHYLRGWFVPDLVSTLVSTVVSAQG